MRRLCRSLFIPRFFFILLGLAAGASPPARAETPALLEEAVGRWLGERDSWALTQLVREFDGNEVEEVREERFDPSQPENRRWTLISINNREATAEEWAAWDKRKNQKRKKPIKPIADYFDLEKAQMVSGDESVVRYALPLKGTANWLFPIEKVQLALTVNKKAKSIERAEARISEPFKVALGLARILDLELDLHMTPTNADDSKADGEARAVVNKLGERVEYIWSDFVRVSTSPSAAAVSSKQ